MDSYKRYEELKKDNAFNDTQAKTLTKVLSNLVTKQYLEERLDILKKDFSNKITNLRKEIKADTKLEITEQITKVKLEIKDIKISMFATAITMTSIIIAAIKFL